MSEAIAAETKPAAGEQARPKRERTPERSKNLYQLQPIDDPRWRVLVERHPRASIFHTAEWLEALRRTYGYTPVAFTTSPPDAPLENGLAFCEAGGWLTRRRLISLPFSDHCEPLLGTPGDLEDLLKGLKHYQQSTGINSLEIRPLEQGVGGQGFAETGSFCFHHLNLRPSLQDLFHTFHKSCVQRVIRRAERDELEYEQGVSESLLARFYGLMVLTRRRQQLPPQPFSWFRNLVAVMGNRLTIRVASSGGRPVASILTLRHKSTLVYKYGCSDKRHNAGGMQLLFWKAIQEAKAQDLTQFDLGRSDWENQGLIDFKDRWGAERRELKYLQYGAAPARSGGWGWPVQVARKVFGNMPPSMLPLAGRLVYRHLHSFRS